MFGISRYSLIPMRAEASDKSELLNQLLFGESYKVLESTEKWLRVETILDSYQGWIDRKLHSSIELSSQGTTSIIRSPNQFLSSKNGKGFIRLPIGAIVSTEIHAIPISGQEYLMHHDSSNQIFDFDELIEHFLNTPYLWGGKSEMGMDCSGFTQVIFRCLGKFLPRDAWQQEKAIDEEVSLSESKKGDLAFFSNDQGRIIHVGIMLDANSIAHCSGICRIDQINTDGIIHTQSRELSHKLHSIKRCTDIFI